MSLGAYGTASFDERGVRTNEQGLTCNGLDAGSDGVEVCKATVRLDDAREGVEGELEHGSLWWRCYAIYAERTSPHHNSGVMALVTHKGGRVLLAVTVHGDPTPADVARLTGEFFERACDALELGETTKATMRAGFAAGVNAAGA